MAYDRSEHVATLRDRAQERAREIMPLVRLVAGAATVMKGLTENEHWNRYLSYLQGMIETWTKARDAARAKLGNTSLTDAELRKLNCDVLVAETWIEALAVAIELPKAIMTGKGEADRIIRDFGTAQENNNADSVAPQS